jgi:hypothetical protein
MFASCQVPAARLSSLSTHELGLDGEYIDDMDGPKRPLFDVGCSMLAGGARCASTGARLRGFAAGVSARLGPASRHCSEAPNSAGARANCPRSLPQARARDLRRGWGPRRGLQRRLATCSSERTLSHPVPYPVSGFESAQLLAAGRGRRTLEA